MNKQAIGVVGMAVMGRNLALNIESRGHAVSIFNRSREKTDAVIAEYPDRRLVPTYTLRAFVDSLEYFPFQLPGDGPYVVLPDRTRGWKHQRAREDSRVQRRVRRHVR